MVLLWVILCIGIRVVVGVGVVVTPGMEVRRACWCWFEGEGTCAFGFGSVCVCVCVVFGILRRYQGWYQSWVRVWVMGVVLVMGRVEGVRRRRVEMDGGGERGSMGNVLQNFKVLWGLLSSGDSYR